MQITTIGLAPETFATLFTLTDDALAAIGARRVMAPADPGIGYPCRISLDFARPGEELLLVNYRHLDQPGSPYRAEGPVFVRRDARRFEARNIQSADHWPPIVMQRMMSVRGYDADGMMIEADVAEKAELQSLVQTWLARSDIAHVDIHSMRRGCFFCRITAA